ncbi:hypothetical protein LTR78_004214 [Recurvomyces mirabilis]|uniref:Wax synthase domain-containing protein n=1 Tax=Recurvomyces mirabilis TaxID=574656 RepID=A0AAE0WQA1_9PEZI|nr:hypothetical protein LTR78_004214 [Recurvomyces mirabilis]KAK5153616.1 hypothetical protein LTS14_007310 [Recurvomyces mirabilis]
MSYTESLFPVAEEIDLHTLLFQPQTPPQAPTLLLLHFCGGSNTTFLPLAKHLSTKHTVIVPSLRGYGRSSRPANPEAYHLTNYASDVVTLLDKLARSEPSLLEHGLVLVGHSMGGKLAQYLLTQSHVASLVKALILLAPAPAQPFTLPPEMKRQQVQAFQDPTTARYVVENVLLGSDAHVNRTITQEQKESLVDDIVHASAEAKAAWPSYGMAEDYERVICDAVVEYVREHDGLHVLVIVGREDRVETIEGVSERTVNVLTAVGAKVDFHVLERVGHLLPVEAPRAVGVLVYEFVDSLRVGAHGNEAVAIDRARFNPTLHTSAFNLEGEWAVVNDVNTSIKRYIYFVAHIACPCYHYAAGVSRNPTLTIAASRTKDARVAMVSLLAWLKSNDYQILGPHLYPEPPIWYHIIPTIVLPTALMIPRTILSRWQNAAVFMPVIAAVTLKAWWEMGGVDVLSVNGLLWALFLLVLKDPWGDFRYVRGREMLERRVVAKDSGKTEVGTGLPSVTGNGSVKEQTATTLQTSLPTTIDHNNNDFYEGETKQPYPSALLARIPWVYTLLISIRLNNWRINSPSHDKTQPPAPAFPTHGAFALQALSSFALGYVVLDLTSVYIAWDPYFQNPNMPLASPLSLPSTLPSALQLLPLRLVRTMTIGAQAWALIGQMFYLPCLLPLTIHYMGWIGDEWSPHNWPPYFGPSSTILKHGVRGFWGSYWHQTMRFTVSAPGYELADLLGFKAGGTIRYAVITFTAFALSGLVHTGLVPPEPLNAIVSPHELRFYVFAFFAVQPIAVLLETLFASLMAKYGGGLERWRSGNGLRIRKLINAIWTISWFTLTLGLIGEMGRQLDWWHYWTVPVSLWKGLRGEGWVAWPVFA